MLSSFSIPPAPKRRFNEPPDCQRFALTTDSSILTAVGNNYGFNRVFSRQIEALGRPNDVAGTRVWAFAHIVEGAVIGKDCNICDYTFVEDQVGMGDRLTV